MKETILVSFSGGRTSAMMTKWLLDNYSDKYEIVVCFANTGHEREKSLKFVNDCDKYFGFNTVWLEGVTSPEGTSAKVVTYETAYRNYLKNGTDPFETMIAEYGIPNVTTPHCSRELKTQTIRAYMRTLGFKNYEYPTHIGIRSDEPKRLKWNKAKKENIVYFAQLGRVTKSDVNLFWKNQKFDLELKSYEGNCILCWKKSDRKLFTIIQEGIKNTDIELKAELDWLQHIHDKYGSYVRETKDSVAPPEGFKMFRDTRGIEDIIKESEGFIDFAIDESNLLATATQVQLWNVDLDYTGGCEESCEAF